MAKLVDLFNFVSVWTVQILIGLVCVGFVVLICYVWVLFCLWLWGIIGWWAVPAIIVITTLINGFVQFVIVDKETYE